MLSAIIQLPILGKTNFLLSEVNSHYSAIVYAEIFIDD